MKFSRRTITEFSSFDPNQWEQLDHADNPFITHGFLAGLESSGSVGPHVGWQPQHLALYDGDTLLAAAPTYVKTNSHGEFVFDWAWADAYHRHGQTYYPKLLTAVPYSPVSGRRLLTRVGHPEQEQLRSELIRYALDVCEQLKLSSWHCNFVSAEEQESFAMAELLSRSDWQFHWRNRNYASFDDFLLGLRSRKRKNIRRERRGVKSAGIEFEWKTGGDIDITDGLFLHRCYTSTFDAYGNHPVLQESFFIRLAQELKNQFQVCIASRDGERLAMSLFLRDGQRLYGRYWGCLQEIPGLHFEAAYYQGIEFCIRNRIKVFESGAQGEHKVSRGFMPVKTRSWHFIRNEEFRDAIAVFLDREQAWLDEYQAELLRHDPFRQDLPR